jgi:hypothetical protein
MRLDTLENFSTYSVVKELLEKDRCSLKAEQQERG